MPIADTLLSATPPASVIPVVHPGVFDTPATFCDADGVGNKKSDSQKTSGPPGANLPHTHTNSCTLKS
ncbi:MAG: hypothetical protein P4L46_03490 [Fimbriimonas sp.]|nr:hypothetical protein [Fimbriimonas sp.]